MGSICTLMGSVSALVGSCFVLLGSRFTLLGRSRDRHFKLLRPVVVFQLDVGVLGEDAHDARSNASVVQGVGSKRGHVGIALVGFAVANVVFRQSSGQGSGADDLHSVVEYKDADGGGAQQVSVYESVLDHLL